MGRREGRKKEELRTRMPQSPHTLAGRVRLIQDDQHDTDPGAREQELDEPLVVATQDPHALAAPQAQGQQTPGQRERALLHVEVRQTGARPGDDDGRARRV